MSLFKPVRQKKEVMLLNPEDNRFTTLQVDRETENVIYCKKHDGILYRFFKLGPGWTEKMTRFLAVEGTPFVSYISDRDTDDKPIYADSSLEAYLKMLFGPKGWNGLPGALKQAVEASERIGTSVNILPYIPDQNMEEKFRQLKAEGVLYDADLDNLAKLGTSTETKKPIDKIIEKLPWILAGFGLTYVLQGLNIIKGIA